MKILKMQNDGSYKKKELKKFKIPKFSKSDVDKTDFRPNTEDVKNLIHGMAGSVRTPLFHFEDGIDNGVPYEMMNANADITEIEETYERLRNQAEESIAKTNKELKKLKDIEEMQEYIKTQEEQKVQNNNQNQA